MSSAFIEEEGYYCDCKDPDKDHGKKTEQFPLRIVGVTKDELCTDCRHYAIYKKKGDSRGSDAYT